jgi:hypothetical protein
MDDVTTLDVWNRWLTRLAGALLGFRCSKGKRPSRMQGWGIRYQQAIMMTARRSMASRTASICIYPRVTTARGLFHS